MVRLLLLIVVGFLQQQHECFSHAHPETATKTNIDTEYLNVPLKHFFHHPPRAVHFQIHPEAAPEQVHAQLDTVNEVLRRNSEWLFATVADRPCTAGSYYNVLFADSYESMKALLGSFSHEHYDSSGRSLLIVPGGNHAASIEAVLITLWGLRIVNVVLIVQDWATVESYSAYTYDPYARGRCEVIEPILLDRFQANRWQNLSAWFPDRLRNFNGCPVKVGTFQAKPFSMARPGRSYQDRKGMEVSVMENVAKHFNFAIKYHVPMGNVKWGVVRAENSTGLMGMIQRTEVEFGFGCIGITVFRNRYLKMGTPNFITMLNMAIPPDLPDTSLEKMFRPFSPMAWLCVVLCYAVFAALTLLMFNTACVNPPEASFRYPGYNLWVLLMGGPSRVLQRNGTRMFMIGFILNTLVIRTMYHAAMFERLQASTKLGTSLATFQDINDANLYYYVYYTGSLYYVDNPLLRDRMRIVKNETRDWDEIMLEIAQHKLKGVFIIPLDCIEYYVKNYGQQGLVFVGKHTSINYNVGVYYPKSSPFTKPFDELIGRFHAAGLIYIWKEQFRDTRYWTNVRSEPEPTSLQWHQISGCFYLWALLLALSLLVLVWERATGIIR